MNSLLVSHERSHGFQVEITTFHTQLCSWWTTWQQLVIHAIQNTEDLAWYDDAENKSVDIHKQATTVVLPHDREKEVDGVKPSPR